MTALLLAGASILAAACAGVAGSVLLALAFMFAAVVLIAVDAAGSRS